MNKLRNTFCGLGAAAVGAVLFIGTAAVHADPPYSMAPPVASAGQDEYQGQNAAQASVFRWTDVPVNQRVPVDHASFDQGGYQIYDTVGETIVVPFENDNLYVMKFALSDDDTMYFVNTGDAPILYVPRGAYLENATVSGARWYPFPQNYTPEAPVFIGPAPSWDAFIGMGWYDGMRFYGGYCWRGPSWGGGIVIALPGLFFDIGGNHFYGWDDYHHYYEGHPGWSHPDFYHPEFYRWANHPSMSRPPFGSVEHPGFEGGGHDGERHPWNSGGGFNGGSHDFRGGDDNHSDRWQGGDHSTGGYRTFHGADGGDNHSWSGDNHNSGGDSHSWGGDNHTFNGGDNHSFSGNDNHSFSSNDNHSFNGGDNHSFGGSNNHTFGGGNSGGHTSGDNNHDSHHDDHSDHGHDDHSNDH